MKEERYAQFVEAERTLAAMIKINPEWYGKIKYRDAMLLVMQDSNIEELQEFMYIANQENLPTPIHIAGL